jgi:hypothetical protein
MAGVAPQTDHSARVGVDPTPEAKARDVGQPREIIENEVGRTHVDFTKPLALLANGLPRPTAAARWVPGHRRLAIPGSSG